MLRLHAGSAVKQLINGHVKNICQLGQKGHIWAALIRLPFGYGLIGDFELTRQSLLRDSCVFSVICNFISQCHGAILLISFLQLQGNSTMTVTKKQ